MVLFCESKPRRKKERILWNVETVKAVNVAIKTCKEPSQLSPVNSVAGAAGYSSAKVRLEAGVGTASEVISRSVGSHFDF